MNSSAKLFPLSLHRDWIFFFISELQLFLISYLNMYKFCYNRLDLSYATNLIRDFYLSSSFL